MTTNEKCRAIIEGIRDICNDERYADKSAVISFSQDWGGNSLTLQIAGMGHTHVGCPSSHATFEELVNSLHALLCEGRGLSIV